MGRKLNQRQKAWLNKFLEQHPAYKLREVWDGLDGDRYLRLEGFERLPMPVILAFADAFAGYRSHTLIVQLRKFGDARKTATYTYTTVYPHCNINEKLGAIEQSGQLSLPISAAVLAVPEAVNPVVVTWKPKQKLKPKQGVQLTLPPSINLSKSTAPCFKDPSCVASYTDDEGAVDLDKFLVPVVGLEAELFRLRQSKHPPKPPVSSQKLLSEKVATWDCRENREIEIPQVVIDLLLAQGANDQEWHSALDLYQIIGLGGVMQYIDGLASVRQHFGYSVSTAAASASVMPAHIKAKASSVSVNALG